MGLVKLFPVPKSALFVELLLRDEHCPPHVHVENEEVPWEARFGFSFVSDTVLLMDVDPIEDTPSKKVIDLIRRAIRANLAKCRKEWWERIGTCCIDNRWMQLTPGGEIFLLKAREKGAGQIATVSYDVGNKMLGVQMKNGTIHTKKAGEGVDP